MASFTPIWQESSEGSGVIANYGDMEFTYGTVTASCGQDKTNLRTTEIVDNGDSYTVNFTVAVEKTYYGAITDYQGSILSSEAHSYIPKELEISIYGDKRVISFEDISASDPNITSAEYVARIGGSELLQDNTVLQEIKEENGEYVESKTKMSDIIKNNIKTDYAEGISDGIASTICSDYNTVSGDKAKDWSQGDLIEPLNCIRVDKDNFGTSASKYKDGSPKLWKVVGRQFDKTGVPLQKLTVQEIRFIETT